MVADNLRELTAYVQELLKKSGASDTVVSAHEGASDEIKFVDSEIIKTTRGTSEGVSFFAVFDKKIVSTPLKELTKESAKAQVAKALKFARVIVPKNDWFGIANGPFKYKQIPDTFDKRIFSINPEENVDLVQAGINAALAEGARRASGIYEASNSNSYTLTSGGAEFELKSTAAYFSIRALAEKDASGHATSTSSMLNKFDASGAGRFAGQIAKQALHPEKGTGGKYSVIFAPMAIAALLEQAGSSLSMFDVEAGTSFFANLIGKQVASPLVTLSDDGTVPNGIGSTICDSEGIPTQRNIGIEKGILKTYLYNTSLARKYKTKTTANAGLISPHNWNIVLEPGKISKDKLFSQVDKGLYITNIWYTRFQNYTTGDFSTIPRDGMFLIENGRIARPVKQLRISENMLNLLKSVSGLANDQQQITSWEVHTPTFTPHVLIKDLNITEPTK